MYSKEAELYANKKLTVSMRVNRDGQIITRWHTIGSNDYRQNMTTQKAYRIYGQK